MFLPRPVLVRWTFSPTYSLPGSQSKYSGGVKTSGNISPDWSTGGIPEESNPEDLPTEGRNQGESSLDLTFYLPPFPPTHLPTTHIPTYPPSPSTRLSVLLSLSNLLFNCPLSFHGTLNHKKTSEGFSLVLTLHFTWSVDEWRGPVGKYKSGVSW